MKSLTFLIACVCPLLLGGCNNPIRPPQPPQPNVKAAYSNFDVFQKELAIRAQAVMGESDDFKIVVTQATFPIGTLMHVSSTEPIDFAACAPTSSTPKYSAPNLFPSYDLSKTLAIDFGLDNAALTELADFGVNVKDADQITFSVKDSELQVLSDVEIRTILSKPRCRLSISDSSVWLIRGYIFGRRNFLLKNESANKFHGKAVQIASFNIDLGSGSQAVSIVDESPKGFLQIVSQITLPKTKRAPAVRYDKAASDRHDKGARTAEDNAAVPEYQDYVRKSKTSGLPEVKIEAPTLVNATGRVYVQSDRLDLSNNAENIVKALQNSSFSVEPNFARIDGSSSPKTAQVRYFSESDNELASRVLVELQKLFPTAVLVRIGLPAPAGQIEIWLPRIQD